MLKFVNNINYIKMMKKSNNKFFLLIFTFLLIGIKIFPLKNILGGSGDAVETWKVVVSFLSQNPYHSYVMYKGVLSIIPNVIFYQLALFFKIDQFFFVKLFYSICFTYISVIGLPFFFSFIFNKKIETFKIYILVIILFLGIGRYFTFINTDILSLTTLILLINCSIKIVARKKISLLYYFYAGIIFSACSTISGQYLPAIFLYVCFVFFKIFIFLKNKKIKLRHILIVISFSVGFFTIKYTNDYFNKTRVEPIRNNSEWLPTGNEWFKWGITYKMLTSKYGSNLTIPDNRGTSILIKEKADLEKIKGGSIVYGYNGYIKLIAKYPLDFLMLWTKRLFLGISVDNNNVSFIYLFTSYTLTFISLLTVKNHCKKIKNIFLNQKTLLLLSFIVSSLVPCLWWTEMRYFISIQVLIISTAILSDTLWKILYKLIYSIKQLIVYKKHFLIKEIKINYTLISYFIFIILCFMLFATIYESLGPNINILFNF